MVNKKILFFVGLAFAVFSVSMVMGASDFLGTFAKGDIVGVKQTCDDGTNLCDYCNVTVMYPSGNISVSNVSMSGKVPFYYNYAQTDFLGEYTVFTLCGLGTTIRQDTYYFDVSPSGFSGNTTALISIVIILIAFAGLFAWTGSTFKAEKWLVKSALFVAALLMMLLAVNVGINFALGERISTLMSSALLVGSVALGLFFLYIIVTYFVGVAKAVKEAKEERNSMDLL